MVYFSYNTKILPHWKLINILHLEITFLTFAVLRGSKTTQTIVDSTPFVNRLLLSRVTPILSTNNHFYIIYHYC